MRIKSIGILLLLMAGAFLLGGVAEAQFAADNFTGTSGTSINGHSLSTGGGTWVTSTGGDETWDYTGTGLVNQSNPGGGFWCLATATNTPPSNYYSVQATITVTTAEAQGAYLVTARQSSNTNANGAGYYGGWNQSFGGGWAVTGGSWGNGLGSSAFTAMSTLPVGVYTVNLTVTNGGSSDNLALTVERASDGDYLNHSGTWQSGSVNCCTASTTGGASPGLVGFWAFQDGSTSPSTSVQFSSFSATNISAGTAYTASFSSASSVTSTSNTTGTPVTIYYTGNGTTSATITPAVSGVSGTFSPTTIALSNTTPVSVTFTPSTTGTATISATNSSSLTNPGNLTETVTAGAATSYTQSLSASSGPVGTAVTITYQANGTGTQTITPSVSGVSGTFSPTTVALNGTTPVTVTFTPSANGTATLTATNSGSLTNPASQTYTVNSATSYTSSESATSGSLGSPVTITYTGNGFSTATITPSVSGVSGTFSPTSIALNNTTSVTVTFTPSSSGTAMLSSTNSGSLTNPSNLTYTVAPGPITIPVSSSAWHFSPGNWAGSSGRTFGTYARTWCNGAYATVYWSTTSSSPTCTLNLTNATGSSDISYFIDNAFVDNVSVPSSGSITVTVSGAGSHVLTFFARNSAQSSRWAENNSYTLTGVTVDNQSTVGTAPAWNGKWVLEVGDSITEGINADPSGNPDNLCDYSHLTGEALVANGYDYGVSACGYSGWIETGDGYGGGDVPRYYDVSSGVYQGNSVSRWCNIDSTTSLLDSNNQISAYGGTGQGPSVITINYGTNEELNGDSQSDMETSIEGCLAALRTAAPNAWILVYVPFNLYDTSIYGNGATYVADINTAVADYQAAHTSDTKTILVDYGSAFAYHMANESGGGVHPNANGHALIGARTSATILSKLTSTTTGRGRILN